MRREIALIALASKRGDRWNKEEFALKGNAVSGEITASYHPAEDTTVEIKIKLPPLYPLKNVEVMNKFLSRLLPSELYDE